jgi:hypothetical protein
MPFGVSRFWGEDLEEERTLPRLIEQIAAQFDVSHSVRTSVSRSSSTTALSLANAARQCRLAALAKAPVKRPRPQGRPQ